MLFVKVDLNDTLQLSQAEQTSLLLVPRAVPATAILDQCPDCPTADDVNTPVVKDTANLSLQKFNKKSSQTNYFRLENVTRASSQVKPKDLRKMMGFFFMTLCFVCLSVGGWSSILCGVHYCGDSVFKENRPW